jgi:hypothetical protein
MTYSVEQYEMEARGFSSRDGSMERPDMQLARDRDWGRIRENKDADRFKEPPSHEPSVSAGEIALRSIQEGLECEIEGGSLQYSTAIWRDIFANIEAYLKSIGCECLGDWFDEFAISAGIENPLIEDLTSPRSNTLLLLFSWG